MIIFEQEYNVFLDECIEFLIGAKKCLSDARYQVEDEFRSKLKDGKTTTAGSII